MKKIALSLLVLLATATCMFAQSDLQILTSVKYNKPENITVKMLKVRCGVYEKQMGKKLTVDERKMVLNALIEEKLVLQAAAKAGLSIPDSTVDQYFAQNMSQSVGAVVSEAELNDMLKKQQGITLDQALQQQVGMNVAEYKLYLKNQLIVQQYILTQKQADIQKQVATDEEIKAFYASNKAQFVWTDMMKVFLVIVPKGSDTNAAKMKAADIKNKYTTKAMTEEQILAASTQPNSGYQSGSMLVPVTAAAAESLGMQFKKLQSMFDQKAGYISDIEETATDFRFMVSLEKYNAKMLAISDIYQPGTNVTVYDAIRSNLTAQKQMQYFQIAAQEVADSLNKPEYVEQKKTGDALDKLLSWGD